MPSKRQALLVDANVLVDYQKSDISILSLVNQHIGEVHVLATILDEVDDLEAVDCERLGLKVIEPELAQVVKASKRKRQLSFRDHLCLIVASDGRLVCVTNDRALRLACSDVGVPTMWGRSRSRHSFGEGRWRLRTQSEPPRRSTSATHSISLPRRSGIS